MRACVCASVCVRVCASVCVHACAQVHACQSIKLWISNQVFIHILNVTHSLQHSCHQSVTDNKMSKYTSPFGNRILLFKITDFDSTLMTPVPHNLSCKFEFLNDK